MRGPNFYQPLKDAHANQAEHAEEQEQQDQLPKPRQDSHSYEVLRETHREVAERQHEPEPHRPDQPKQENGRQAQHPNRTQEPEVYLTPEDKREAQLAARNQELEAKLRAGLIAPWEKGYELRKYENALAVADRAAEQRQARAQPEGRAEQQRAPGQQQERDAAEASAQRQEHDSAPEMTDKKQQQQDKAARFRELMNESEQGHSSDRGHDGGGRER